MTAKRVGLFLDGGGVKSSARARFFLPHPTIFTPPPEGLEGGRGVKIGKGGSGGERRGGG